GEWSPSNNAAPSNMTRQGSTQYDNDAVGDGNVTMSRKFTSVSTTLDTVFKYDFRNRRTDARGPDNVAVQSTYDNLNRTTLEQTYADANVNFVIDAGELRQQRTTATDEGGRVYRSSLFNVDPVTGAVGNAQTTNTWFNARGMTVKTRSPNGLFRKS